MVGVTHARTHTRLTFVLFTRLILSVSNFLVHTVHVSLYFLYIVSICHYAYTSTLVHNMCTYAK